MEQEVQYDRGSLCKCLHPAESHMHKGKGTCDWAAWGPEPCGCHEFEHITKAYIRSLSDQEFRTYSGSIRILGEDIQILVREIIEEDGTRACHIAFRQYSVDTWSPPQRIEIV